MFKKIQKNIKKTRNERLTLESLKEQFTEKTIKQIFESHLAIYPETAVGVGDSWRKTVVTTRGQPIIERKYLDVEGKKKWYRDY